MRRNLHLTKIMATRDEYSDVVAAHELPALQPALRRSLVPLLYAGIGVALGTLTGLSLTLIGAPSDNSSAFYAATTTSVTSPATTVRLNAPSTPNVVSQPASVVQVADAIKSSPDAGDSASINSAVRTAQPDCSDQADCAPESRVAPARTPAVEEHAAPVRARQKERQPHSLIHPFARQARPVLASLDQTAPVEMDDPPSDQDQVDQTSQFYTEGDLTVADYDATDGTIQTSDGRTFVIGTTVTMSNAASWDDYRSSVHYRCGENGSCMLERAGVVAPNARLI